MVSPLQSTRVFGGATLAILWQGLSNVTGMTIGMSSLVVAAAMIVFAFFTTESKSMWARFFIRSFTAFCRRVRRNSALHRKHRLEFFADVSRYCRFSIGTGLYSAADFGRGSYEAVTFSLAEKNNFKVKFVRPVLDVLMVVVGVLLGGKFGMCTVLTVVLSGPIIQLTADIVKKSRFFSENA